MANRALPGGTATDGTNGWWVGWRGAYSQLTLPAGEHVDSSGKRPILITRARTFVNGRSGYPTVTLRIGFGGASSRQLSGTFTRTAAGTASLTGYQTINAFFDDSNGTLSRRFWIQNSFSDEYIRIGKNGSTTNIRGYSFTGDISTGTAVDQGGGLAGGLCGDYDWFSAPPAPSSLSVEKNETAGSLDISWGPSSVTGSVAALDGYTVQISTSSNFSGATSYTYNATTTSATISGLNSETEYYVRVAARNAVTARAGTTSAWRDLGGTVEPTPEADAPVWSTAAQLDGGTVNVSYATTVTATSDDPAGIIYSKVSGASWISVSSAGQVFGTPTAAGSYSVVIEAKNSNPTGTQRTFFITVVEQAPFWVPENQSLNSLVVINRDYISNFNATNVIEDNPYSFSGILPAGITFDTQNGDFGGKPTQTGTFNNIYVRARGKDGTTITKGPYTLKVIYPGQRQTSTGTFESFVQGQRFAPGEEGASFTGWKNLSFMKRWNGDFWEDLS
jgi:hypothetical protein